MHVYMYVCGCVYQLCVGVPSEATGGHQVLWNKILPLYSVTVYEDRYQRNPLTGMSILVLTVNLLKIKRVPII